MADQSQQNSEILQELKAIKTNNENSGGGGKGNKKNASIVASHVIREVTASAGNLTKTRTPAQPIGNR